MFMLTTKKRGSAGAAGPLCAASSTSGGRYAACAAFSRVKILLAVRKTSTPTVCSSGDAVGFLIWLRL